MLKNRPTKNSPEKEFWLAPNVLKHWPRGNNFTGCSIRVVYHLGVMAVPVQLLGSPKVL